MPADPRRVTDLFVAALDLPDIPARRAFLDRECVGDVGLRRRLDVLLAAHDRPDDALGPPFPTPSEADDVATRSVRPADATAAVGVVVAGRFKLLEMIGEGGMGDVWMAEQREPVKRLVALKLIKPGMDSRSVLARFEAERQALALMDHPNIAKVLDGGTTPDGRPYFVMELVKGLPLTEYCDVRRMSVRDRLEMFAQVCSAVQHAHQKGVIHRDLKPSNVLVTEHDGKPVPKVIDFGLAKALTATNVLTEKTLHTAFGAVVGTPLYMAPEQVGINALDVDTRTDVYALGVILYELLTGSTPLEKKSLREAAWEEMRRLIREEEPPRPSARLSSSAALPSLAAGRQIEPARLTKLVRGELDWIVMKALEKDRNRRYETANGLAMDVQRHLAGEPVQAVPPSAAYRLRKFARKHSTGLTMTGVVAVLLVAAVVISGWQALRATRAERRLRASLGEAQRAKLKAEDLQRQADAARRQSESVTNYLVKLIRSPDPTNGGRDVKVSDLLDRAAAELDSEFANSPETKADLLVTLGETYDGLRSYEKMADVLERALALREATLGPDHPATLETMAGLAAAFRGAGRPDKALSLAEKALELSTKRRGANHPGTLFTAAVLGDAYRTAGQADLAVRLLEPSLRLCRINLGTRDQITLKTMNDLGLAYLMANRAADAVACLEELLDLRRAAYSADHPELLLGTANLAMAYAAAGRVAEVAELLEPSLGICRSKLGPGHPTTLYTMRNLAQAYDASGQTAKAEQLYAESANAARQQFGNQSIELAGALASLGSHYLHQNRFASAEPVLRESLTIRTAKLPDSWQTFDAQSLLGGALLGQRKHGEAEPILLAGYGGMKKRQVGIPPLWWRKPLPEALDRLVELYKALGKPDEAAKWQAERAKYDAEPSPPRAAAQ